MTNLNKSNEMKQFIFFEHTPNVLLDDKGTTIKYTFSEDLMNQAMSQITENNDLDLNYKAFNEVLAYLHKAEKDEGKDLGSVKPNLQDLFKLLHNLIDERNNASLIQKNSVTQAATTDSNPSFNLCNLLKALTNDEYTINNESTEKIIYHGPTDAKSAPSEGSSNDVKSVAYTSMKEHLPNLYNTRSSDLDEAHVTIINAHILTLTSTVEGLKEEILENLFRSIETVESKTTNTFNLLIPLADGKNAHFYKISNFSGDWNAFKDKASAANSSDEFRRLCESSNIYGFDITTLENQTLTTCYFLDCNPKNIKEKTKFEIICHENLISFINLSSPYMLDDKTNKLDRFLEQGLKTYGPGIEKNITGTHGSGFLEQEQVPNYAQMSSALFIKPSEESGNLFSETIDQEIKKIRGTDFNADLTYVYSDLDSNTLKSEYVNDLFEDNILKILYKLNEGKYAIAIEALKDQKCFSGVYYNIVGNIDSNDAISNICPPSPFPQTTNPACKSSGQIKTIYFYSTINHKQDYLNTFSKFNFQSLKDKLSSDYFLPNDKAMKPSKFIDLEYKISNQSYYLIKTNAEAADYLKTNQEKFTLADLQKNLLERNCFFYSIHKIDLNESFTFYEPKRGAGEDDYMISSVNIKYDNASQIYKIKEIAYQSKTIQEFIDGIKKIGIKNEITILSEQIGKVEYIWEPSPDKDFIMKRHKYVCIPNTEVDQALQDGKFENFKTFIDKKNALTLNDSITIDSGHGANFFRRIREKIKDEKGQEVEVEVVERFAFFFLDVDSSSNARTYVIDPCLDKNTSKNPNALDTNEKRLDAWTAHYRTFKSMSGYKFSTFWEAYKKSYSSETAYVIIQNPEYKIYGNGRDSNQYRIGISDNARSTANSDIFDPIRTAISQDEHNMSVSSVNWTFHNPEYSCLDFPADANDKKGCTELRYARELQKKGEGFCDT